MKPLAIGVHGSSIPNGHCGSLMMASYEAHELIGDPNEAIQLAHLDK